MYSGWHHPDPSACFTRHPRNRACTLVSVFRSTMSRKTSCLDIAAQLYTHTLFGPSLWS